MRGVDVGVLRQGQFHHGIVLAAAEDDTDGRQLSVGLHVAVEVVDVHLHLTQILMGQLAALQVDQDIAAQQPIVEDEVHEEVAVVEREPFLTGLEQEAFAQFEQEVLEAIDDGRFQLGLGIGGFFFQTQKFQDERILDEIRRFLDYLPLAGKPPYFVPVAAERQSFVQGTGDLPFQLAHAPLIPGRLDLVEGALIGVSDGQEGDVMGPAESESAFQQADGLARWVRQHGQRRRELVRRCRTDWGGPGLRRDARRGRQ